jgi:hypothetical protein
MTANRNGKRLNSTVIISPELKGMGMVVSRGLSADRAFEKLGWTQGGNLFMAPDGWKTNGTIHLLHTRLPAGKKLIAFTYHDRDSRKIVTVATETNNAKAADQYMRKLGWKSPRGQWVAP